MAWKNNHFPLFMQVQLFVYGHKIVLNLLISGAYFLTFDLNLSRDK